MKSTTRNNEAGVVLIVVLTMLTLFGIVGLTFVYFAAEADCSHNPTIEVRDGRCTKVIGTNRR